MYESVLEKRSSKQIREIRIRKHRQEVCRSVRERYEQPCRIRFTCMTTKHGTYDTWYYVRFVHTLGYNFGTTCFANTRQIAQAISILIKYITKPQNKQIHIQLLLLIEFTVSTSISEDLARSISNTIIIVRLRESVQLFR